MRCSSFRNVQYTQSVEESKALNSKRGPIVIIAASGMAESGRILHHLANGAGDPRNTILVVGFMAEGTLGRRIVEQQPTIRVYGEDVAAARARSRSSTATARTPIARNSANWIDAVRAQSPSAGRRVARAWRTRRAGCLCRDARCERLSRALPRRPGTTTHDVVTDAPHYRVAARFHSLRGMLRPERPFYLRRRVVLGTAAAIVLLWLGSVGAVLTWALQDDARKGGRHHRDGRRAISGEAIARASRATRPRAGALAARTCPANAAHGRDRIEGDTASEAAVGRVYMIGHGVPDTAILLENEGRTSAQSLRCRGRRCCMRADLANAMVVSDPFHMLRLEILGRRYGMDPYTSPALPAPGSQHLLRRWGISSPNPSRHRSRCSWIGSGQVSVVPRAA